MSVGKETKGDAGTADELFGSTVIMESPAEPTTTAFDGTVMLEDASELAPAALTADGTVMLDSASHPAGPLRHADDTSLPPSLGPTPAPPQAADFTFDATNPEAPELMRVSPSVPPAATHASPSDLAVASPPPPVAAPRNPILRPQRTLERRLDFVPAEGGESRRDETGVARRSSRPEDGRRKAARRSPKTRMKVPFWALLLALVVIAGLIGHLIARMQSEAPPPAPTRRR
jgi:hypothetical protein